MAAENTLNTITYEHDSSYTEILLPTDISIFSVPPNFNCDDIVYCDSPYITVNGNIPFFTDEQKLYTDPFIFLSELDNLGRCGTCAANIYHELQPEGEREPIGNVKPSGWHTVKYNGIIEDNYLYNRSHLLGWQLTGLNDDNRNLITGTRSFNVDGMLPFENMLDNAIETNHYLHILYRVTPIYKDNELVARGVLMEAWSVEDLGKTICFNVFVYNKQPMIQIDYSTGESWLTESAQNNNTYSDSTLLPSSVSFILNTNSKKFHYPDCSSVLDMSPKNKFEYYGRRADIISMGYSPCKSCNP